MLPGAADSVLHSDVGRAFRRRETIRRTAVALAEVVRPGVGFEGVSQMLMSSRFALRAILLAALVGVQVPAQLAAQVPAAAPPAAPKAVAPVAAAKAWPQTRPEATGFAETSRYDEVVAFMKAMAAASPQIKLTTYGYTYEGRPMPLAVIGAPGVTPEQVKATGKTRIYIQGNIHAGEVEGKEACLWLLRSIAKGERAAWLKDVVLLINPIYNADGNERVSVANRGSQ